MCHWDHHTLLVEMKNSAAALESSLAVPQNVEQSHHLTQQSHS